MTSQQIEDLCELFELATGIALPEPAEDDPKFWAFEMCWAMFGNDLAKEIMPFTLAIGVRQKLVLKTHGDPFRPVEE